jgi:hypothetical protein
LTLTVLLLLGSERHGRSFVREPLEAATPATD